MTSPQTSARTPVRPVRRLRLPTTGGPWRPRLRSGPGAGPWRRGPLLVTSALLLGLLLSLHAHIPQSGGLGSLVETFLPWSGLFVPVLLAAAWWRRSASAVLALVVPVAVWLNLFGGLLGDRSRPGGDFTLVSHNVAAENPDPAGTAREMAASGADVLALEELSAQAVGAYEKGLSRAYPYHTVQGTVGLWSRLPLSGTAPVDLQQDVGPLGDRKPAALQRADDRALRTTVTTDSGPLTVYVAHLGSVRVNPASGFWTESRDRNARALGKALAADRSERVVLLGDLNGTVDDRALDGVTAHLTPVQDAAGAGFGFSWPRSFPVARIDHILVRGVEPARAWLLPATASDHLPVAAEISW